MKLVILSVRDAAADAFGRPMFAQSVGAATRSFFDEIGRSAEDNMMFKHPVDFDLFLLGVFDDQDGHITLEELPKLVAKGSSSLSA